VSTYNPTIEYQKEQIIKDGLTNTTHTVVGTYIGNDPSNPNPTGNGRGWARWLKGYEEGHIGNQLDILYSNITSNKDMAFGINAGTNTTWIPEHSGIGTVYQVEPPTIILDGQDFDINSLGDNVSVEFTDFKYIQNCVIRFPDVTGDIAELKFIHQFSKDGVLHYSGSLKALKDITIYGYPAMLPLNQSLIKEAVTSLGASKISDSSNNEYYFEKGTYISAAGVSEDYPDFIAAVTVEY